MNDRMFLNHRRFLSTRILVVIIAIAAFFAYSFFALSGVEKFDSPDENSNYIFSQRLASGQTMTAPLTAELNDQELTYARNTWVQNGRVVPGGFLGFIELYGTIAQLFGAWTLPFLTPLFSSLAIFCFGHLVEKIWGRRIALVSAALMAIHPAFWYYSARGMFHNVLFVDLVILALWALTMALKAKASRRLFFYPLAGFALGLSITVRTAEVVWLSVLIMLLVIAWRRHLDWKFGVWAALVASLIPLSVMVFQNKEVFGGFFTSGYSRGLAQGVLLNVADANFFILIKNIIFPFGVDLVGAMSRAWSFGLNLVWWISLPSVFGFFLVIRQRQQINARSQYVYCLLLMFVAVWLWVLYGSWNVHDDPDPSTVALGISYVRYWLPIYIFSLPLAAVAFAWALRQWKNRLTRQTHKLVVGLCGGLLVWLSASIVVSEPAYGLAVIRQHAVDYAQVAAAVRKVTPENSVIVSGRSDKYLWPDRTVIFAVENPDQDRVVRRLMLKVPVYVFLSSVETISEARASWQPRGFNLTDEQLLPNNARIYRLEILTHDDQS